jgi:hypothetical protein
MICNARDLAAVVVLAVLTANRGDCQPPPAFGPSYATRPGMSVFPSAEVGQMQAPPTVLPNRGPQVDHHGAPVPQCNPFEDNNGPLLKGDALLDDKCSSPPGWFAAAEADVVVAHIKNRLFGHVGNDTIHLPTAELDWTVSPRFELGYRFGQGVGDFLVSYRFLVTSGSGVLPGFDANQNAAALHSRLNINSWDIDYGNWENSLLPFCEMRWRIGARVAANFFDSKAASPLLEQRVSNYFVGGGPHVGLDLRHAIRKTGLSVLGRFESAFLIGETYQSYEQVFSVGPVGGANRILQPQTVPLVSAQAGLEWTPPGNEHLHFSAGYTYEHWWNYADVLTNRSDMWSQGFFFRGEFRY